MNSMKIGPYIEFYKYQIFLKLFTQIDCQWNLILDFIIDKCDCTRNICETVTSLGSYVVGLLLLARN